MMRTVVFISAGRVAVLLAALAMAACASSNKAGGSSTLQAFADNPAPSTQPTTIASTIVESMAGGLIGGTLGTRLDARQRRHALESEYRALEYTPAGEAVTWGDRDNRYGEVMAGAPYRVGSQDCRQYVHTVYIDGQAQSARGAACRNSDGSWSPLA